VASSLIRINEATAAELEELPSIGPRRAERIVRYREQVAPLSGLADLQAAAGIGPAVAQNLSPLIDWRNGNHPVVANLLFSLAGAIACVFLYRYAIAGARLVGPGPATQFYRLTVLVLLMASLTTLLVQLLHGIGKPVKAPRWIAATLLASGGILLVSLLLFTLAAIDDDDFTSHVIATVKLIAFITVIVGLLYGPGWHVRSALRHFDIAAIAFDYGQLVLGGLALMLLLCANPPDLVDELFGIWTGITLLINAREMVYGRSSYVSTLSKREQATINFLVREETATVDAARSTRWLRPAGWLLGFMAVTLVAITARMLFVFD